MKALVIVDIQRDFLQGGLLAVPHGDEIIPLVNQLQSRYDLVVATQDWHPYDHESFVSQHAEYNAFDEIDLYGLSQRLWPDHCMQGTSGADFSDLLDMRAVEAIFRKGLDRQIDSYSGFFDNGRRKNTGLHGYLQDRAISEVHICGLAADYCVYNTALDALSLGYKTAIVSKGTRPIDKDSYISKKEIFIQKGGFFV